MSATGPFAEIADGVFHARYPQWDVGVGLVVGASGALVVDTRAGLRQGLEVADDIRRLGVAVPVTHVVDTHVHFDHTFGNAAFADATVLAHEAAALALSDHAEETKAQGRADLVGLDPADPRAADLRDLVHSPVRRPDVAVAATHQLDLGGRVVDLWWVGRGHTGGDLAVGVVDAGVTFLGDLVEESGPPAAGDDSYPLEWATTLERHLVAMGPSDVVVPGHGTPVDPVFVREQRDAWALVATVIGERHAAAVPLLDAAREPDARLPFPLDTLADAFARGYAQLDAAGS